MNWSQDRQTRGLTIAIWMGHDAYPALINTAIIDFEGRPKPIAHELAKIWKSKK